jgi:hypothetical protein
MNKTRVTDMLIGGLLTGLLTGLCWSSVAELFSNAQISDGVKMLLYLSVPALAALLVRRMWRVSVPVLLAVAYLTMIIPLFGIGFGGANILQMTLGGTIGGVVWMSPFAACRAAYRRFKR